jgi:hypothetical protein
VINAVTLDPITFALINPFTAVFTSPVSRQRVSPRLDYQLNTANTLTFRYGFTRTDTENGGIGGLNLASRATNTLLTEHAYQVVETAILGPHIVDESRFQLLRQHNQQDAVARGVAINVAGAFSGGGPTNPDSGFIHHHYEFQNYVMMALGSHAVKGGLRLRAVQVYDTTEQNFDGSYTFGGAYAPVLPSPNQPAAPGIVCDPKNPTPDCQTISSIEQYRRTRVFQQQGLLPAEIRRLGGGATQFNLTTGNPYGMVGQVDVGLFIGDDWRVRPNFTLTYGLRYETQTNIGDHSDFSPRLGFAWAPGNKGRGRAKTVIRGGFGIFYERMNEQNTLLAERYNGINQVQYSVLNPDFSLKDHPPLSASSVTRRIISSSLRAPIELQSAIGIERQLPRNTTVAVTWTVNRGTHELISRNINAPLPGTYIAGVSGSGIYPYGLNAGPIYEMESMAVFRQRLLVVNVNSRVNRKIALFGYYSANRANSNTDGVNSFPANQYSMAGEYGPHNSDIHNRSNIGGTITSVWNLRFSPLIVLQSGAPFDITTSQDIFGSTLSTARPGFASNPNEAGVVKTPYGVLNPNPLPGETVLPRNYGRGPGQFSVDLRVARTFALRRERSRRATAGQAAEGGARQPGPEIASGATARRGIGGFGDDLGTPGGGGGGGARNYNLTVSISGRNILNHVNQGPIVGNINSPLFGESNQIAGSGGAFGGNANNRRLEFQLRLAF